MKTNHRRRTPNSLLGTIALALMAAAASNCSSSDPTEDPPTTTGDEDAAPKADASIDAPKDTATSQDTGPKPDVAADAVTEAEAGPPTMGLDQAPAAQKLADVTFPRAVVNAVGSDDLNFVIYGDKDVALLDVSDPQTPKIGATITTSQKALAVEYDEPRGMAYLVDASNIASAVRVMTPTSIQALSTTTVAFTGSAKALAITRVGNRLFVLGADKNVHAIDIITAGSVVSLAYSGVAAALTDAATHMVSGAGALYLAYASGTVESYQPSASTLKKLAEVKTGGEIKGLVAKGSKVLALPKNVGMQVVDFGAPDKPKVIYQDTELKDVSQARLFGRTLMVGLDRGMVSTIDLSNMSVPRAVTSNKIPLPTFIAAAQGNLFFGTGTAAQVAGVPAFVTATVPAIVAKDFPLNGQVSLGFSKPLDPTTVTAAVVKMSCAGAAVEGTPVLSQDGRVLSFHPTALLPTGKSCKFEFTGIKDKQHQAPSLPAGATASIDITTPAQAAQPIVHKGSAYKHTVDGAFTDWKDSTSTKYEWSDIKPAKGMYTYFYADYDGTNLNILNDWFFNGENIDPDCYNLFQVWTGGGKQQWEIRAFGDKHVEVLQNGQKVDAKSKGVQAGFAYASSPNVATPHTMYEIMLPADPGDWGVRLHDPGPTFACHRLEQEPTPVRGSLSNASTVDAGPDAAAAGPTTTIDTTYVLKPPSAPTLAQPANKAALSIPVTLSWEPADWKSQVVYQVQLSMTDKFTEGFYNAVAFQPSFAIPTGVLADGKQYYWRVIAWNAVGNTASEARSFTVGEVEAIDAGPDVIADAGRDVIVDAGSDVIADASWDVMADLAPGSFCGGMNTSDVYDPGPRTGGKFMAFKYTPSANLTANRVEVFTSSPGVPAENSVGIYSHNDATNAPGQPIAQLVYWSPTGTSPIWQGAALSEPVGLQAGRTYWIIWHPVGGQVSSMMTRGTGSTVSYRGSDDGLTWDGPYDGSIKFRIGCEN